MAEHLGRDANVGDGHTAAKFSSWQKEMSRLLAKEGHGLDRLRRAAAEHLAAVAGKPARHVDRDHGQVPRAGLLDDGRGGALERSCQPGTEQSVDHDRRSPVQELVRERQDRALPEAGMMGGVASQALALTQQSQPHLRARGGQMPGRDEAVAAVVARTAEHDHRPARRDPLDRGGHGGTGLLHQVDAGNAAGHGGGIGGIHLFDAENREDVAIRLKAHPWSLRQGQCRL